MFSFCFVVKRIYIIIVAGVIKVFGKRFKDVVMYGAGGGGGGGRGGSVF